MSNQPIGARLAALRGRLPSEEPGARGVERVARNPECMRLRALTLVGITPATAAHEVYQEPINEGQSTFALGIGTQFERNLTEHGAANFLELYRNNGRLTVQECKVVIVPYLAPLSTRDPQKLAAALARRQPET